MNAKLRIIVDKDGAFWFLEFDKGITVDNEHGYMRNGRPCVSSCKREAYRIAGKLGLVIIEVVDD